MRGKAKENRVNFEVFRKNFLENHSGFSYFRRKSRMSNIPFDPASPAVRRLLSNLNSSFRVRLFFLLKLPSLLFWKVRVASVDPDIGKVEIRFSWRTQNPFQSTYFAALAGTGELSTGMLAMVAMEGRGPMSMLVTRLEGQYSKRGLGRTVFTCEDGPKIREAVDRAYATGEGQEVEVLSIGRGEDGTEVCRFLLNWSFKPRRKKD